MIPEELKASPGESAISTPVSVPTRHAPTGAPDRGGTHPRILRSWPGYGIAVASVVATLWWRLAMDATLGSRPSLVIFTIPIMLSAYLGGLGPGLLATAFSFLAASYYLLPPIHSFAIASGADRWQQSFVALAGVVISGLNEALHRARDRANLATAKQQQGSETLREREELFSTVFRLSPDGVVITRLSDRVVIQSNEAIDRIFTPAPDKVIGQSGKTLSNWLNDGARLALIQQLQEKGEVRDLESSVQIHGGQPVVLSLSARLVTLHGERCILGVLRDITERKRTEAVVAQLAAIVASSEDAIIGKDLQGVITSWNAGAEKTFGYTAHEMIGHPFTRLIPLDRRAEETEILSRVRRGESVRHLDTVRLHKDGRAIDVAVTVSPIRDETGKLIGTSKVARDIRDRKQADAAARDSEERFRTMANSMSHLAWIARADGFIFWYNRRWYEYTGKTPEEMEGWGWQSVHDPVALPQVMGLWQEAIAAGTTFEMEFPLRGGDGSFRNFLTRGEPFRNSDGQVVQWFGTNTDVTALKQAQESIRQLNADLEQRVIERTAQLEAANQQLRESRADLNSLFESLPGSYLVMRPDLTIVAASDAYLAATLTTRESIVGQKLFDVFPDNPADLGPSAVSAMRDSIDRVIQKGAPDTMAISKHDIRRPDGVFEEHYWSPVNSPMFGSDRRIKYVVHRVEEVTEFVRQKSQSANTNATSNRVQQMEAEVFNSSRTLQSTIRQLDLANKELEAFSYSVAHDLRAPLRSIDGYSQVMLEDFGTSLPESGQSCLKTIRASTQAMGRLIDDLLAFSRLSRQALNKQTINTDALVRSTLAELGSPWPDRQVNLRIGDLPACAGDVGLLKQVWVNLLSNALKYSRKRATAEIEVGCSHIDDVDTFFVRDNGTGFDMRYADKLFGVFQRLHRAEDFEGTGVGLAIVQRIVHRHGGRIWADASVDHGATFSFTLQRESTP